MNQPNDPTPDAPLTVEQLIEWYAVGVREWNRTRWGNDADLPPCERCGGECAGWNANCPVHGKGADAAGFKALADALNRLRAAPERVVAELERHAKRADEDESCALAAGDVDAANLLNAVAVAYRHARQIVEGK